MKKILSVLIAVILLLTLAACTGDITDTVGSAESAPPSSEEVSSEVSSDTSELQSNDTASTEDKVPSPEAEALLKSAIEASAAKYGADAIQVAVISEGRVAATAEYGWAEKDKRPLERDSLIRVASLSKTVVGMVAFRLIDEGKLSLDDDISKYFGVTVRNPSYPDVPITVRMLLGHTSSIKNSTYSYGLESLKRQLAGGSVFSSNRPGSRWSYTNYGFGVLGVVCEIAGGKGLTTLAREYFFEPMGIDAAFTAALLDRERLAVIYKADGSIGYTVDELIKMGKTTQEPGARMVRFAGNLTISAEDYAKLMTLLVNEGMYEGSQLLSKESVETMLTPQCTSGGIERCLPVWRKAGVYGLDYGYYHTGSYNGVYSLFVIDPVTNRGVVVSTTGASGGRDSYGCYAVCGDIVGTVLQNSDLF